MYTFEDAPFKVRYTTLDPNDIFNYLCPNEKQIKGQNDRNQFFSKLERSILDEGIRNPILCWALEEWPEKEDKSFKYYKFYNKEQRFSKHLLPEKYQDKKILLVCRTHGGSRLMVAQKHNIRVPCLISDFCDAFPEIPPLKSIEEISKKYKDQPKNIFLGKLGIAVIHLPQVHLKLKDK